MIKHAEIFFDNKICMSSIRDELYPPLPYNISSRFRHFINLIYKKESSKESTQQWLCINAIVSIYQHC